MTVRKIRVLVAEHSVATRELLVNLLESDPRISVVRAVGDGEAALESVGKLKPDVVLMDLQMHPLDGFEATRRIMETHPVPIVICSANSSIDDAAIAFRAMEAGAIACVKKPASREHPDFERASAHLLETVRLMSEVKVVRRTGRGSAGAAQALPSGEAANAGRAVPRTKVVGIGASTGGPPVLQAILGELPKDYPAPILIVQHIADGFLTGMVDWLNQTTALQVHIASYGTRPLPGHVYLAPDDFHMRVGPAGGIVLTREAPLNHLRPAVSVLFRSLAEAHGPDAMGVLLTGMGRDGAAELKLMRDRGAITIAQDRDSSVVHGMPGAAIALGGATHILAADAIGAALMTLIRR